MKALMLAAAAAVMASGASAAAPKKPVASASQFRIDKARIDKALQQMVADGRAAGTSALVWKDGREVYFGTAGYADREAKKPMRRDTLVQIFSMTKPVTGVAIMQLWEQGKFGLDDPLSMYLPDFANTKVFIGKDSAGNPILQAPRRPILIRDVLRHTAGFGYGPGDSYPEQAFATADPLNLNNELTEFGRRLATVPLLYEPGTKWRYSSAVDVQALLVEKLSGQPYETYVRQHILDPLGMKDSGWTQPEANFARLARGYVKGPDGTLQRKSDTDLRRMNFDPARKLTMGGAGIVSSLDDYMRFARMLLNKGSLEGVQLLKPSTVKLMSTNHLDARVTERQWLPDKGNGGFGFDFAVRTGQPKTAEENRGAVGEFFWDGAWTTLFWVDPANNLAAVYFVQSDPFNRSLHRDIRRAVYGDNYLGPKGD
ncbi:beta-lactamase family protein [Sphingomonas sp. SM33]|uniref:Beta-lactamase family protein n=1 Tax=Sphingomonas telluris TaxID=2907998 RepID=A0ABS9VLH5_9SPHN|nr:serine hydrolase domain-containing protein [Sphingomonas telluris]MCH8615573.1 beta-lactamase family protein [Sphingomonas telluris]